MSLMHRAGFKAWNPSSDLVNGDKLGLLRADNLVRDEQGDLNLRPGSATLNTTALESSTSSVHSLYTAWIEDVRYRLAGVDSAVYSNFSRISTGFAGTGDIKFGSFKGQALMARSTTRRKYDGGSVRNWGIQATPSKPGLSAVDPDFLVVGTFDDNESPKWEATEGGVAGTKGQDGTTGGARACIPGQTTGKVTVQRVFGSGQNFQSYTGGDTGTDEDLIELYLQITLPDKLEYITISFDVNPASKGAFNDDYYFTQVDLGDTNTTKLDDPADALSDKYEVEGFDRDDFENKLAKRRASRATRIRLDSPAGDNGWTKFQIPRGSFLRVGSTPGCDWTTVKAIQVSMKYVVEGGDAGVQLGVIRLDQMRFVGGAHHPLTGKFTAKVVFVKKFLNDAGTIEYIAKSTPSPISDEIELRGNALDVSVSGATDLQLLETGGEIWVYLAGGTLNRFLRFATASIGAGSASARCQVSERDAIVLDERLESDAVPPPNDVVAIVGPHYNRVIVITRDTLWPSSRGNPDTFRNGTAFTYSDSSERARWGVMLHNEIYIGTNKNVYRLDGKGDELEDGTLDFNLTPLNMPAALSDFYAQEGNDLAYLASDGPVLFSGQGVISLTDSLFMLLKEPRYGVSSPNLGSDPGRFRGAISGKKLFLLWPEGASTLSSNVVYVYSFLTREWERRIYPRSFQVIYRELDGQVLAGDSSGFVWQLESNTTFNGDVGPTGPIAIPVAWWTVSDDDGKPHNEKQAFDYRINLDSGGVDVNVLLYADESTSIGRSASVNQTSSVETIVRIEDFPRYTRMQRKIEGSFFRFKLRHDAVAYRTAPIRRVFWDTGFPDFGDELFWIREIKIKARIEQPVDVILYVDQIPKIVATIPVPQIGALPTSVLADSIGEVVFDMPMGPPGFRGRVGRITFAAHLTDIALPGTPFGRTPTFEVYWVRVKRRISGQVTAYKWATIPGTIDDGA